MTLQALEQAIARRFWCNEWDNNPASNNMVNALIDGEHTFVLPDELRGNVRTPVQSSFQSTKDNNNRPRYVIDRVKGEGLPIDGKVSYRIVLNHDPELNTKLRKMVAMGTFETWALSGVNEAGTWNVDRSEEKPTTEEILAYSKYNARTDPMAPRWA